MTTKAKCQTVICVLPTLKHVAFFSSWLGRYGDIFSGLQLSYRLDKHKLVAKECLKMGLQLAARNAERPLQLLELESLYPGFLDMGTLVRLDACKSLRRLGAGLTRPCCVSQLTDLVELRVQSDPLDNPSVEHLRGIQQLTSLTHLDVDICSVDELSSYLCPLPDAPGMKQLSLDNVPLMSSMFSTISGMTAMTSLYLCESFKLEGDAGSQDLIRGLQPLQELRSLSVLKLSSSKFALTGLVGALSPHLTCLQLTLPSAAVPVSCIIRMSERLIALKKLHFEDLSCDDTAMIVIVEKLSTLTELTMNSSNITRACLPALSQRTNLRPNAVVPVTCK